MTAQITIVGLGQIGASIGLALGGYRADLKRVGHDKVPETARAAQKNGAVDEIKFNLPASVRQADLILLCLPLDQMRATLEIIAPDLKEDAVVMDVAPLKSVIAVWCKELLPPGRHYVGLVPALNPQYLFSTESGLQAARADLLKEGLVLVDAPLGTPAAALQLASDLIRLLGAAPLFTDRAEADGLMAAMHILPQLVSAALLEATLDQPGWRDARRVGGRPYTLVTAGLAGADDADALREAALLNRENVVRMLDAMMASLQNLRDGITAGASDDLSKRLKRAQEERALWWQQRQSGQWLAERREQIDVPAFSKRLRQAVLGKWGERLER